MTRPFVRREASAASAIMWLSIDTSIEVSASCSPEEMRRQTALIMRKSPPPCPAKFSSVPVEGRLSFHISLYFPSCPHNFNGAVAVLCEGGHGEGGSDIVLKLHRHYLMVNHIVVTVINTAAVRTCNDCFIEAFFRWKRVQDSAGPLWADVQKTGLFIFNINLFRIKGTILFLAAAVHTPPCRAFRGILLCKMIQGAERGDS